MNEEKKESRLVEIADGMVAVVYDCSDFRILIAKDEEKDDELPRISSTGSFICPYDDMVILSYEPHKAAPFIERLIYKIKCKMEWHKMNKKYRKEK